MNVTILSVGSRGDVQPYIALGRGLAQAGHTVRLTTHETFKALITNYGLDFSPIGGNVKAIVHGEAGQTAIASGSNPFKVLPSMSKALEPILGEVLENSWKACQDADLIISSGTAFWGDDIAEHRGIPSVFALLQPVVINRQIASPITPPSLLHLGSAFNWLTHQIVNRLYWSLFQGPINQWRQQTLGEPPRRECPFFRDRWFSTPKLFGYSPSVLPAPADWNSNCHVTGYWFLDAPSEFTPPQDLLDFLESGDAPVSIGFGSMASRDAENLTGIALAALKKTGQRGILLTGWSGISNTDLPADVFKLEAIPHDWLFPKMKAIVHHGGAGTTSAALRSGIPSVVVPFFADQPFWGDRLARLQVSPDPIPKPQLSVDRLAIAIHRAASDTILRQRASHLGTSIRLEKGVDQAVQLIQQVLSQSLQA